MSGEDAVRLLLLASLAGVAGGASAMPPHEKALVLAIPGSERDAIALRSENGEGAVLFLPEPGGRFSIRILGALGPDVVEITAGDVNGDGAVDLVVTRADASVGVWLGDGTGDYRPEEPAAGTHHHGSHDDPAALAAALRPVRPDGEELLASLRRAGAAATRSETDASAALAGVTLPSGFAPRLAVTGRFGPAGEERVAVVGTGPRPRLALVGDGEARELLVPEATFTVNVGQGGLVFAPASVSILENDTVHWVWIGNVHNVVSGTACVADNKFCSPSNTSCSTTPTSNAGAVYDRTFPLAGSFPYFCRVHCDFGMTGLVSVTAAAPGVVPRDVIVAGTPLTVNKAAAGEITLSWAASCGAGATGYGIYEGIVPLPGAYNHVAKTCALGAVTSATLTPGSANHYYLVVPQSATVEGSYGRNGAGSQIPQGALSCRATQDLTPCP